MILYNVTTKVDWSIHIDWVKWMKDVHNPEMMATGYFTECRMLRLLKVDEDDGPTYAVQYFTETIDDYDTFVVRQMAIQSQKEANKWGDKFISFSTIMEVVQ